MSYLSWNKSKQTVIYKSKGMKEHLERITWISEGLIPCNVSCASVRQHWFTSCKAAGAVWTPDAQNGTKVSFTPPQLASPAISARSGSWHFWPSGWESPIFWLLSLIRPCGPWSEADCVSSPAQMGQWGLLVPLVCRHPKLKLSSSMGVPVFSKGRGLQTVTQCGRIQSFLSANHSSIYRSVTILHARAPQQAA